MEKKIEKTVNTIPLYLIAVSLVFLTIGLRDGKWITDVPNIDYAIGTAFMSGGVFALALVGQFWNTLKITMAKIAVETISLKRKMDEFEDLKKDAATKLNDLRAQVVIETDKMMAIKEFYDNIKKG